MLTSAQERLQQSPSNSNNNSLLGSSSVGDEEMQTEEDPVNLNEDANNDVEGTIPA